MFSCEREQEQELYIQHTMLNSDEEYAMPATLICLFLCVFSGH